MKAVNQHLHLKIYNAAVEDVQQGVNNSSLQDISIKKLDGSGKQTYHNARLLSVDDNSVSIELIVQRT